MEVKIEETTPPMTNEERIKQIDAAIDLNIQAISLGNDKLRESVKLSQKYSEEAGKLSVELITHEAALNSLKKERDKLVIPQWNPKRYVLVGNMSNIGKITELSAVNGFFEKNTLELVNAGVTRETEEEAIECATALRRYARLLAYQNEFAKGYKFSNGTENYYISFNNDGVSKFVIYIDGYNEDFCKVYFPEDVAKELVRKINSGEYEL